MITGLSPLARLDEMHPTLAKFSVPALREQRQLDGVRGEDHGTWSRQGADGVTGGLSLAAAFKIIEERKEELEVRENGG